MDKSLAGKVVLITGGGSGIGAATAIQSAREGAKVVVAGRRLEKLVSVKDAIESIGGECLAVRADVTVRADVESLVSQTVSKFGRLDCAVNNAGIGGPSSTPMADVEEADWDKLMATNLKSVWLCMKYQIPAMLKQGSGAIVNISSIYGYKPSDLGHSPYATSKFAVIGLSKSAAVDYGQSGIRINVVAPGFTRSEMMDPDAMPPKAINAILSRHSGQKRLGEAEETAQAITWLCSDAASYVNGAVLTVDGGNTARLY